MEISITVRDGKFLICLPEGAPPVQKISDWPGWRRWPNGSYSAPAYAASVLAVRSSPGLQVRWTEAAAALRDHLLSGLQHARGALKTRIPPGLVPNVPTARKPLPHQLSAILAARSLEWQVLLNDDMGLGKTSTALWCLGDSGCKRAVVICPVSVKYNWQAEAEATLGDDWRVTVIDGTPKQRAQQFVDACTGNEGIIVLNYDLLRHLSAEQQSKLNDFMMDSFLILDESHYCKSRDAERTKRVIQLSRYAKHRMLLTGTPIRNLADDLYTQIEIARPGTWTSYHDFAKRHLVVEQVTFGKRPVQKIVAAKNLDALNAVLNTLQIQRKKEDVLDLPPMVETYPKLRLDGDTARLYDAMKRDAKLSLAQLDPKTTIFDPRAKSAVEQVMRCEQIAQGFCGGIPEPIMDKLSASVLKTACKIKGRPNELIWPNSPKVVWLLEAIESVRAQGGAPLVFTRFNAPAEWLAHHLTTELGIHTAFLHGGLDATGKREYVDWFQAKKIDCLICQVKIAEGWNATRSQDVLFLGRDWSPAINAQAAARAHRHGQKGTVNVQIPIVLGTIEELIDRRLRAKGADAQQALRTVTIAELMEAL